MRNAEEFPEQPSDFTQVAPTFRRPGPGAGGRPGTGPRPGPGPRPGTARIRYAHGGFVPRVEPLCTVPQGEYGHHGGDGTTAGIGSIGELGGEAWSARFPVTRRHNDLWVLVCGGIAAAAAFAAAFAASGGLTSHPATPASVPAVVSQACPSLAP
jgi:hypothetical protein